MTDPPLILASSSPRRASLLREAGYRFRQVTPPFDDSDADLTAMPVRKLAAALAYRKAMSVADSISEGVVIGCDTLVSLEGRAIGKPVDEEDARRTLRSLIGRGHEVVSAVYIIDAATKREGMFAEVARVTIHPPGDERLEEYIRSGRWRGKAGGYNLAELQGVWRLDVEGDPTAVVGLPMQRLAEQLERFAPRARGGPHL